jgi:hypothetical protein
MKKRVPSILALAFCWCMLFTSTRMLYAQAGAQKIEQLAKQLNVVHEQIDPQVRSILTPAQYQKLQEIRKKDVEQAIRKNT